MFDEVITDGQPGNPGELGGMGANGGAAGNGGEGGTLQAHQPGSSAVDPDFNVITSSIGGQPGQPGQEGPGGKGRLGGTGGRLAQCKTVRIGSDVTTNCWLTSERAPTAQPAPFGPQGIIGAKGVVGETMTPRATVLSFKDYIFLSAWPVENMQTFLQLAITANDQSALEWIVQITPPPNDAIYNTLPNREDLSRIHQQALSALKRTEK